MEVDQNIYVQKLLSRIHELTAENLLQAAAIDQLQAELGVLRRQTADDTKGQ